MPRLKRSSPWPPVLVAALLCGFAAAQAPPPPPAPGGAMAAAARPAAPAPQPLSLSERADIMMARKEYYAAADLLREGLRNEPRNAGFANRIGIAYQMLNQPVNAAHYYEQAIHLNRRMAQPYNNLGTIYYDERNYGKALKLYHRAIHLSHGQVATYYVNAGTAEFMRKHYQQAGKNYLTALRLDPEALDPTRAAGNVLQDSSVTDPAQYHFFLCRLYCQFGDLADAMHQFRQALELQYPHIGQMCRDPVFKALIARPDFQRVITPPAPGEPLPPVSPGLKMLGDLAACRLPPPAATPPAKTAGSAARP